MDKFIKSLFSTRTMAVLLVLYAALMGYATFVERDYGTDAAKSLIYDAHWFELLQVWLILIFVYNIPRYNLLKRPKWPLLVFHLSFLFIFIGGAITRYISFEGMMTIYEGETQSEVISDKTYFKFFVTDGSSPSAARAYEIPYKLSALNEKSGGPFGIHHDFEKTLKYQGKEVKVRLLDFVPMAKDSLAIDPKGKTILKLVSTGQGGRVEHYIPSGSIEQVNGLVISFNQPTPGTIQIVERDNQLFINSPLEGNAVSMMGQQMGMVTDSAAFREKQRIIKKDTFQSMEILNLYSIAERQFVLPSLPTRGEIIRLKGDKDNQMEKELPGWIQMEVSYDGKKDTIDFSGRKGITEVGTTTQLNNLQITAGYGSKKEMLPFGVKLRDFQLERYPGSDKASSYASEVSVVDEGKETPFRIYMNNILRHKGYRFYQSSFTPDEQGTILSVNQDWWGTTISYIGYMMLFFGLTIALFWKGTRFWNLNNQLKKLSNKSLIFILFFLSMGALQAQEDPHAGHDHAEESDPFGGLAMDESQLSFLDADAITQKINIPKSHSDKFGKLLVQDFEGRIEPVNTMALDILRKLTKKEKYHHLDANQWFLWLMTGNPREWSRLPMIKVGAEGGEDLVKFTGANEDKFTSMSRILMNHTFHPKDNFNLDESYQEAFRKKPADRSKRDNDILALTEKFNILDQASRGLYLKIFPRQNDLNNTWVSAIHYTQVEGEGGAMKDSLVLDEKSIKLYLNYLTAVSNAYQNNNWKAADQALDDIIKYQRYWGKDVLPADEKVAIEIFYNKVNIFFYAMIGYTILGAIMLILGFAQLFTDKKWLKKVAMATLILTGILALAQAVGLFLRWYISGHAPWSNGYEAIVFIAWMAVVMSFALYRNKNLLIPASGALVAVVMMGFAHGGVLLNPQITPLVPVLKSYWLNIHVSIIISSYAFFGLSAVIGLIALILLMVKPSPRVKHALKELTIISEMSLTVGLLCLAIGTFLGGMWANESWGRYWSWDPKETWAFISVIVYAFVLHMRLVPGLKSTFAYHLAATWAVWSIVMTYFGVNYYLSGLHSYAAGDPIPVPLEVKLAVVLMFILSVTSYVFIYLRKRKA